MRNLPQQPCEPTYCPFHERRLFNRPYYAWVIFLMGANWLIRSWSLFNTDAAGGSSAVIGSELWPYIYLFAGIALILIAHCMKWRPTWQLAAMAIGVAVYGTRAATVILGDFDFLDVAHVWSDDMMAAILIGASWSTLVLKRRSNE